MALTRIRVRVRGRWHNVEVGDLDSSPVTVVVDGEAFVVEVEGLPAAAPARPRRGRTQTPGILVPPPASRVNPTSADPSSTGGAVIRSPMPGRVISILVRPGDAVSVGQELCVVEAMKMEQSIRSPQNGVVKEIRVQPTDSVRTNDPLLELE